MNLKKYEIKDECKALLARIYSNIYMIYAKIMSCDQSSQAAKQPSSQAAKQPSTQVPNN